ncbi:hypothetical protein CYMTET_26922 [Cymbomonas tetramitiformis]|uniref:tetraacyldisaccharide 4'-kinase n=1 Tax=Cymbomonas tetramitiformis TaxID=36881 RepID=A0AAE0FRE4_9CHLO|nr:hypothetical protein CYMTET_26922 [Cymbomonas tetramitiformis]
MLHPDPGRWCSYLLAPHQPFVLRQVCPAVVVDGRTRVLALMRVAVRVAADCDGERAHRLGQRLLDPARATARAPRCARLDGRFQYTLEGVFAGVCIWDRCGGFLCGAAAALCMGIAAWRRCVIGCGCSAVPIWRCNDFGGIALPRADVVVLHHVDLVDPSRIAALREDIMRRSHDAALLLTSCMQPTDLLPVPAPARSTRCSSLSSSTAASPGANGALDSQGVVPLEVLRGVSVVCASGIGCPASLRELLYKLGARHVTSFEFDDHHHFTRQELHDVARALKDMKASQAATQQPPPRVVITEKDYARCPDMIQEVLHAEGALVLRCDLHLGTEEEAEALDELLASKMNMVFQQASDCGASAFAAAVRQYGAPVAVSAGGIESDGVVVSAYGFHVEEDSDGDGGASSWWSLGWARLPETQDDVLNQPFFGGACSFAPAEESFVEPEEKSSIEPIEKSFVDSNQELFPDSGSEKPVVGAPGCASAVRS